MDIYLTKKHLRVIKVLVKTDNNLRNPKNKIKRITTLLITINPAFWLQKKMGLRNTRLRRTPKLILERRARSATLWSTVNKTMNCWNERHLVVNKVIKWVFAY